MTTPILGLSDLLPNDPTSYATLNWNQRVMESLVRKILVSNVLTAPPGSPAEGDLHFVAATATGAWAGHDNKLAAYISGTWQFLPLYSGQKFWVTSSSAELRWNGSAWV